MKLTIITQLGVLCCNQYNTVAFIYQSIYIYVCMCVCVYDRSK